jgi:hypothetical protein
VSVGRPDRAHVLRRIRRQTYRGARRDRHNVNIEIVLLLAIPGEGHLGAIGGDRRIRFEPAERRQWHRASARLSSAIPEREERASPSDRQRYDCGDPRDDFALPRWNGGGLNLSDVPHGLFFHFRPEPVAVLCQRFDISRLFGGVPERLPQPRHRSV